MQLYLNILSSEDIDHINNMEEVMTAEENFNIHYRFSVSLPYQIVNKINMAFGTKVNMNEVPMMLLRGDVNMQVEGEVYFMFLDSRSGVCTFSNGSYPIMENTGFKFNEDYNIVGTGNGIILTIGPMDINGDPM